MQPALAPQCRDAPDSYLVPDPIVQTARRLAGMLAAGQPIRRETLRDLMTSATGRSDAGGGWTLRDSYDALELAQILFATGPASPIDERDPASTLQAPRGSRRVAPDADASRRGAGPASGFFDAFPARMASGARSPTLGRRSGARALGRHRSARLLRGARRLQTHPERDRSWPKAVASPRPIRRRPSADTTAS